MLNLMEKSKLQELINRISEIKEDQDLCFKALQRLNSKYGDHHAWCSLEANLEGSLGTVAQREALTNFRDYWVDAGYIRALNDLGSILAEMGFWEDSKK